MKSFICLVVIFCVFSSIHTFQLNSEDTEAMNKMMVIHFKAALYYRYMAQNSEIHNLNALKKFFIKLANIKYQNYLDIFHYISRRTNALWMYQMNCGSNPYICQKAPKKFIDSIHRAFDAEVWNYNNTIHTISIVNNIPMRHFLLNFQMEGAEILRQIDYIKSTISHFSTYFELYMFNEGFVDNLGSVKSLFDSKDTIAPET